MKKFSMSLFTQNTLSNEASDYKQGTQFLYGTVQNYFHVTSVSTLTRIAKYYKTNSKVENFLNTVDLSVGRAVA